MDCGHVVVLMVGARTRRNCHPIERIRVPVIELGLRSVIAAFRVGATMFSFEDRHAPCHSWTVAEVDCFASDGLLLFELLSAVVDVLDLAVDQIQNLRVGDLHDIVPQSV